MVNPWMDDLRLMKALTFISINEKSLFVTLFLLFLTVGTTSCSILLKGEVQECDSDNGRWVCIGSGYHRFHKFRYQNVVLVFDESIVKHWVSIGPPVFPIIPHSTPRHGVNIKPLSEDRFYLPLEISSETDVTSIDISEIQVTVENKTLRPSVVRFDEIDGKRPAEARESVKKVVISNQRAKYTLIFDAGEYKPSKFSLDIGTIQVNDTNIRVPVLKCQKRNKYYYYPFTILAD
jgi:hypothetical protein